MLQSILCPVDFSPHSQHALRWAVALAARRHGRLLVMTAVDPLLAEAARARYGTDLAGTDTGSALRAFVEEVVPANAAWAPAITFDVRVGNPTDLIIDAAERESTDLVVMGTQGLGGFRKLLLGSTTECVLRQTRAPVLAVPPQTKDPAPADESRANLPVDRVLAATDFSGTSLRAVAWAADLARDLGVPVVLAHVVGAPTVPPQWQPLMVESADARAGEARAKLEDLAQRACTGHPYEVLVTVGRPADAIASAAEERHAGIIVMGLTSEGGPLSRRPGSIAYRVLSLAAVPVAVVPPE
jgi:nucleotide-binding universal stress UspA family protein